MKNLLLFVLLLLSTFSFAQFQFTSPMPGSRLVNPEHLIAIREGRLLQNKSLKKELFTITGNVSGNHDFKIVLARDVKTINLIPRDHFACNEKVTVNIAAGLQATDETTIGGYSFSFYTHREYTASEKENFLFARE